MVLRCRPEGKSDKQRVARVYVYSDGGEGKRRFSDERWQRQWWKERDRKRERYSGEIAALR